MHTKTNGCFQKVPSTKYIYESQETPKVVLLEAFTKGVCWVWGASERCVSKNLLDIQSFIKYNVSQSNVAGSSCLQRNLRSERSPFGEECLLRHNLRSKQCIVIKYISIQYNNTVYVLFTKQKLNKALPPPSSRYLAFSLSIFPYYSTFRIVASSLRLDLVATSGPPSMPNIYFIP